MKFDKSIRFQVPRSSSPRPELAGRARRDRLRLLLQLRGDDDLDGVVPAHALQVDDELFCQTLRIKNVPKRAWRLPRGRSSLHFPVWRLRFSKSSQN